MKSKLIQILSEDYEALFKIPQNTTEEKIRSYWSEYTAFKEVVCEETNFEDFMDEIFPEAEFERQFLEEINL